MEQRAHLKATSVIEGGHFQPARIVVLPSRSLLGRDRTSSCSGGLQCVGSTPLSLAVRYGDSLRRNGEPNGI